jgi:hypothetical protein
MFLKLGTPVIDFVYIVSGTDTESNKPSKTLPGRFLLVNYRKDQEEVHTKESRVFI